MKQFNAKKFVRTFFLDVYKRQAMCSAWPLPAMTYWRKRPGRMGPDAPFSTRWAVFLPTAMEMIFYGGRKEPL